MTEEITAYGTLDVPTDPALQADLYGCVKCHQAKGEGRSHLRYIKWNVFLLWPAVLVLFGAAIIWRVFSPAILGTSDERAGALALLRETIGLGYETVREWSDWWTRKYSATPAADERTPGSHAGSSSRNSRSGITSASASFMRRGPR